jgi:predicted secreted hydrolase
VIRRRRELVLAAAGLLHAAGARATQGAARAVGGDAAGAALAPRPLAFPLDLGAHPDARIEWWYLTGHLDGPDGAGAAPAPIGIQLTFFRMRSGIDPANPSRFAAHQLVLAHAAIADPARGALLHEERYAREGFGVAQAPVGGPGPWRVAVDRWHLDRDTAGAYAGSVRAAAFTLDFTATPTQPILLQGEHGYSRKGGDTAGHPAASFYYTEPQLRLQAELAIDGRTQRRSGTAWLDHEWSSSLLPPQAAGWDWGGYNLADGSALTVFRIRARPGAAGARTLHAYACLRKPGQEAQHIPPAQIAFTPLQYWTSPRTRARYPVAQRLQVGGRVFETHPLMPDQEYAARAGGGVVYWEGASTLHEGGRPVGQGYLELTGYAGAAPGTSLDG